ncbi:adenylate kinase ADK2 [Sugiyamaella lignohabitans]|uniref:GTP:AMP phosphotransferase, mitochondrial n=1 Tax=Sugiyamaella lignohabitans TaxID=796027 RepID=A0A167DS02_9ASCO|nr:adenylate kinase ADK2 [Sugiyamaella lignohabitans]ANB13222.1 adenylate kinase ADK2 [Sugiyamaella lignohabitans]
MTRVRRPLRALFLGAPGAGKGTQVSRLLRDFKGIPAISSGDLLRDNIQKGTKVGKEAATIIKDGGLVPDSTMVSLIGTELQNRGWLNSESSWLLDGFPRTVSQAPALDSILNKSGAALNLVVELKVPEEVILDRIENRWVHAKSGRIYNLTFNPPKVPGKDDITGEPLTKRPDDNPEVFKQRLDKYREMTLPLLDYYGEKGLLHSFQGETSDIIYPQIKKFVGTNFAE